MEGLLAFIVIGFVIIYIIQRNNKNKSEQDKLNKYILQNTNEKNHKKADKYYQNNNYNNTENYPCNSIVGQPNNVQNYDIKTAYRKRNLLTDNEKRYYNVLSNYAEKNNLQLLSKIRLADLLDVDWKYAKRDIDKKISFSKISSKHIDFALCNKTDLEPILLIEVDDSSHNKPDRIERDKFIDSTLRGAGYKIIHITTPIDLDTHLDYLTATT